MRYQNPQLIELLAAEYVLGTLRGRARRRFEGLLEAHPAMRRPVREWEMRLNRLAGASAPVPPPPAVWEGVQERLFRASPERTGWFERLAFWRGLALGSGALAAVLAVLLLLPLTRQVPGYMVMIHDRASHEPVWAVSVPRDLNRFYVKNMKPLETPKNIRCLLWLQPEGSGEFYALGTIPDKGGELMLEVDQAMRPMLPGKLLVSVEDADRPMPERPSGTPRFIGEWMPVKGI